MTEVTNPTKSSKRKKIIQIMAIFFIVLAVLYFIYWLIWGRFEIYTDDAYVSGNQVQLMPQVSGTVIKIYADNTQLVKQGDTIIVLDPTDTAIALEQAKANLADTVRQVRQYFANVKKSKAEISLREADLYKAQLDVKRRVGLVGERAVSREDLQHYQTALTTARAQYQYAQQNLTIALAQVENTTLYSHPLVLRAKAKLKAAYLNHRRTIIVAPVTGIVAKRNIEVGQQVNPQTPMLAIVPLSEVWVDANYKESQLSHIRIGQPVELEADANSLTYHGKVEGLNAGTGAAFALLPAQNATGNWIKIVQRLPVRIKLDEQELKDHPLQIGLSMRVTTYVHDLSGSRLPTRIYHQPIYQTNVYANQLADVNTLIERILRENSPDVSLNTNSR